MGVIGTEDGWLSQDEGAQMIYGIHLGDGQVAKETKTKTSEWKMLEKGNSSGNKSLVIFYKPSVVSFEGLETIVQICIKSETMISPV